jgi:DNA processing protein
VPGPITSAASAGCHRLLQEGIATVVTDARDASDLLDSTDPVGFGADRKFEFNFIQSRPRRLEPDISL